MKENIIVSACLTGEKCRYDGESKPCGNVIALGEKYNLTAVCPEVLGGLKVPREKCEIKNGRVFSESGKDLTREFKSGALKVLEIAEKNNCRTAVLKSNSPSCGKNTVYDGSFSQTLVRGKGFTAALLEENGIKILDENEINTN